MEKETKLFFDLDYFARPVIDAHLEEAEKYLSSFTEVNDNMFSARIYFELRRQKYLEALHK
ncbi:hypothetical protein Dsin_016415 [Dipteronia sinensis]|uniref:CTLH domain-containing protein n=1 Tax=Dipteronia sinensis TaxID=43782 RepID=A0AAE0ADB6_9ROSI|nr:hypothetical protein Dsin_016415 [Dipteronia sinensis]